MNCCSRSTLGIIIGIINLLCFIGLIIFAVVSLLAPHKIERQKTMSLNKLTFLYIIVIVFSTIMATFAALMITGIAKRRHELIAPWLVLSSAGFLLNCGYLILKLIGTLVSGNYFSIVFLLLFVNLIGLVISAVILWFVFSLYDDIWQKTKEKSERKMTSYAGINYRKW